jgi:hypothetical protein
MTCVEPTEQVRRSWTVGLRACWLAVPEDERPVVQEAAFETLATLQAADGSLVVDQTVRVPTGRRDG